MKKYISSGIVLCAVFALGGCGGGSTPPESAAKSLNQATGLEPPLTAAYSSELASVRTTLHSTDALVGNATIGTKSVSGPSSTRKVAFGSQKRAMVAKSTEIKLGPPSSEELIELQRSNQTADVRMGRKAFQIGFARPVSGDGITKSAQAPITWTTLANGNMQATVSYASQGAVGIRLGMLVSALPSSATLYAVGAADSTSAIQTTGALINQAIAANVLADGDSAEARTYWLPAIEGEVAQLVIELPAGTPVETVALSVPSLIHMVQTAPQASVAIANQKSSCPSVTPDVSCSTPLPPAANAVDAYDFVKNGYSYVCTGTLVSDKAASGIPYVLTANHCIPNQTVATSMESYWFYRTSACNSSTVNPGYVITYDGATLLYAKTDATTNTRNPVGTDTTFVRLNAAPPAGVTYVGWNNDRQAIGSSTSYTAIHSPQGAFLRQSTGIVSGMGVVNSAGDLSPTQDPTQPMYETTWSSGITESGSSGSGLFRDGATSNPKIVGQLWGGSSTCAAPGFPDYYGRFDLAYQNGLINWLNPGYQMVFRFFNGSNGAHFFSANVSERDGVRNTNLALGYEGPVFSVGSGPGTGLSPVYRFYNTSNGAHFYTISESERASVQASAPWYKFEGVAWYARQNANPGNGSIPVYRFYVKSLGTHLYTVSASERDYIIQNLGFNYNYEGIAYQAWSAS